MHSPCGVRVAHLGTSYSPFGPDEGSIRCRVNIHRLPGSSACRCRRVLELDRHLVHECPQYVSRECSAQSGCAHSVAVSVTNMPSWQQRSPPVYVPSEHDGFRACARTSVHGTKAGFAGRPSMVPFCRSNWRCLVHGHCDRRENLPLYGRPWRCVLIRCRSVAQAFGRLTTSRNGESKLYVLSRKLAPVPQDAMNVRFESIPRPGSPMIPTLAWWT